ncbi:putative flavin-nucleotide-binding protein [Rosellinia necatrix]|uniref:Putative flavin-nucleotide-binding protein n=1 Tax=Rosellinia necatrix TaxID=77044 RepID=A0A1W2TJL3_ROSNE|nr:putative flavin-nucleotide-binding protein [Rosellinia necatrix]
MPSESLEYPTKPYSKVNRYDVRATYALKTIHELVNTCPILHVSFTMPDSPYPMMLPMIGQMGSFARPSADMGDVLELYLHGYVSSRLINLSRGSGSSSGEGQGEGKGEEEAGLPVTVGASHLDGLVLALTPNSHSYNYRSAVLFGRAELVTDEAERLWAMELVTNGVVRDRYRHTRVPPNRAEMQSTSILRVRVAAGSAKIRSGTPSDERADKEDEALLARVWTGVVPVHYTMGTPIPGPYNRVETLPSYLEEFVRDGNEDARAVAAEAAAKVMKGKPKEED